MTTFKQTVKEIKAAEKCVDKVLKAARLTRNPVSYDWKWESISDTIIAVTAILSMTGIFAMMIFTVR